MPRVLVVDDHTLFREALASLISSKPGYEVVGQAGDGEAAVRLAGELHPEMILMDISMPVMDGIAATRAITERFPEVKVAMLTMLADQADLFSALAAGAVGYILKDSSPQELFARLQAMAEGRRTVEPALAGEVLTKLAKRAPQPPPPGKLSSREREVLRLVAEGASNKAIADALGIAENTVKKHLSNLLGELGLENRTQLALYAATQGLAGERR